MTELDRLAAMEWDIMDLSIKLKSVVDELDEFKRKVELAEVEIEKLRSVMVKEFTAPSQDKFRTFTSPARESSEEKE